MKYLIYLCVCLFLLAILTGCEFLTQPPSPGAVEAGEAIVAGLLAAGTISAEKAAELIAAMRSGLNWLEMLALIVGGGTPVTLGAVRLMRGPPTQKVGLSSSKVHPVT